jgi:lysozyme
MPRFTSSDGLIAFLKTKEGWRNKAYWDDASPPVLTIGYGHTNRAGGFQFKEGAVITLAQGESILRTDLKKFEGWVNDLVKVPITQSMFDALVSFCYNVGPDIDSDNKAEGLGDSTLLKKLNARDYRGAAAQFAVWNKAGGRVLKGLTTRRKEEATMFLEDGIPGERGVVGQTPSGKTTVPPASQKPPPAPAPKPVPRPVPPPAPKVVPVEPDPVPAEAYAKLDENQIMQFQTKLDSVGYHGVGRIDGRFGNATLGAMNEFQRDFGLPVTKYPTKETLARLAVTPDGSRPIDKARQEAGTADVQEDAPKVIQTTLWAKMWSKIIGWIGGGGIFGSIGLLFGGETIDRVFGLPPWLLGVFVVCFTILAACGFGFYLLSRRATDNIVEAYQERKIV